MLQDHHQTYDEHDLESHRAQVRRSAALTSDLPVAEYRTVRPFGSSSVFPGCQRTYVTAFFKSAGEDGGKNCQDCRTCEANRTQISHYGCGEEPTRTTGTNVNRARNRHVETLQAPCVFIKALKQRAVSHRNETKRAHRRNRKQVRIVASRAAKQIPHAAGSVGRFRDARHLRGSVSRRIRTRPGTTTD